MKHMYVFIWLTLLLGWATTAQAQTVYEAETAITNGDLFYNYSGATGPQGGIVANMHPGRYVSFTVQVAQAGHYSAILRYSTGFTTDQKLAVEVNGCFNQPAVFAPTGRWDGWQPHTVVLALRAGVNTITYRAGSPETGYISMDHLKVAPAQTVYEAETAATNGEIFHNYPRATGGGIVGNLHPGRYVSFTVQVARAGYHNLILRYATGLTSNQKLAVEINGAFSQQAVFAPTGTWDGWQPHTLEVALRAGVNTIIYRAGSPETGYINIDHLKVEPVAGVDNLSLLASNPYTHVIDSLTQHLNKGQISTGILYDRVLPLGRLHVFNANKVDTTSEDHVRQAYLELTTAAYTPTTSRYSADQLYKRVDVLARHDSVPLVVLDYRFHYLDTLAVQDNLLRVQNGLYQDVPGRSRSPYLQRDLVLAAPMAKTVEQSTQFYLARDLFLGNRSRSVSSLLASTELGYRTLYAEAPRLQAGKNKGLRLPVQPPAWVKIKLVDEPPTSKIWLYVTGYEGGEFGNGEDHFTFPQSQTYVRPVFAGTTRRVRWRVTDQVGVERTDFKEFIVAPLDTAVVEIRF